MQLKQILRLFILLFTVGACNDKANLPIPTSENFTNNLKKADLLYDTVNWFSTPQYSSGIIALSEISGICSSPANDSCFWVHEDKNSEAKIQLLQPNGKVMGSYRFPGTGVTDMEDIAIAKNPDTGVNEIFIGDIGDNNAVRPYIKIIILSDTILREDEELIATQVKQVKIQYRAINTNEPVQHDCEALVADPLSGHIYLFTKSAKSSIIYKVSSPYFLNEMNDAVAIGEFMYTGQRVTAADLSLDGMQFILKTHEHLFLWQRLSPKETLDSLFKRAPVELPYKAEVQGEAVCFSPNNKQYITVSEKASGIDPKLYFYSRKN